MARTTRRSPFAILVLTLVRARPPLPPGPPARRPPAPWARPSSPVPSTDASGRGAVESTRPRAPRPSEPRRRSPRRPRLPPRRRSPPHPPRRRRPPRTATRPRHGHRPRLLLLGSFTGNSGLVPVLREVPQTTGVAGAAMRALLAGPNAEELGARPAMYTDIPDGTRLLGLAISNGVATVNLSAEFGAAATHSSATGRLAQVVYTLTQFPTVTRVRYPAGRLPSPVAARRGPVATTSSAELPAIFVDRPAWGAAAGNPVKVTGVANVFEATFRVQVQDANGHVLADKQVMAELRHRLLGRLLGHGRVLGGQGPVGHPPRLRPLGQGRHRPRTSPSTRSG